MLTAYFGHCGKDVKLKLFKTYCYNMYSSHPWSEYPKTSYDLIRVTFNYIFCNLLGIQSGDSISAAFENVCMHNLYIFKRKFVYNFIARLKALML